MSGGQRESTQRRGGKGRLAVHETCSKHHGRANDSQLLTVLTTNRATKDNASGNATPHFHVLYGGQGGEKIITWCQAGSAGEVLLYHIAEGIHDLQSSLDGVGLVLWQGTGSDKSGGVGAATTKGVGVPYPRVDERRQPKAGYHDVALVVSSKFLAKTDGRHCQ